MVTIKNISQLCQYFCLGICLAVSLPSLAADKPNLLIMGEDADKDTVVRSSRVFKRVLNALSNQMHDVGFDVFDETAITLDDFAQGRVRRTDAEIIDIARSIQRPPIDVAVIFSIYASAKEKGHTTKIRSRIEGRLMNVKTGQRLGNFEVESPNEWNAEPKCSRECILEVVGGYSKVLSDDLGAVLSEKLAWMVDGGDSEGGVAGEGESQLPTAYSLLFDGFSPDEVLSIEEYLVMFSGYKNHRPTYSSDRRAEFWYESTIKTAKLNRNLQKMLAALELRGRVQFSGNTYTVQKITLRRQRKKRINDGGW